MRIVRTTILTLAVCGIPASAQDDGDDEGDGGGFLENRIESALSGPGFEVDVRDFEGALSSRATLGALIISDDDGPWLTINDAVLDWNRSALLRGRLEVEELTAAEILVPRTPEGDPQPPSAEAQPFSLPDLPVRVQIGLIRADRVALGEPLFGEAAEVSLNGSATLADGALDADLQIARVDGQEGTFDIDAAFDADQNLDVDIQVDEAADGIVVNLIDLPGLPSLEASIVGAGPLSDFSADIALATDGEPRLEGAVALSETDEGAQGFAANLGGDIAALFTPQYRPFFGENIQLDVAGAQLAEGGLRLDELSLMADAIDLDGSAVIGADGAPDLIALQGEIASGDGSKVLLPVGSDIRVDRVGLDVDFDADEGETWTGRVAIEGFEQPGIDIDELALDGTGAIAGAGDELAVDADLDFRAVGLSPDGAALGESLGERIDGNAVIAWSAGTPVELRSLTVEGAAFALDGSGEVDPQGENVPVALSAALDAADLSAFAALSGQSGLRGAADVQLDLTAEALSGAFDVALEGRTQDLATGIAQLDPLIDGETRLTLRAERDETGTRLETLDLQNASLSLTGDADLTSDDGTADLELTLNDLSELDPQLEGTADLSIEAERSFASIDVSVSGGGAGIVIDADGRLGDLEADTPFAEGTFSLRGGQLERFSALAGRELGGAFDISGQGRGRIDLSEAQVALDGALTDLAVGIEAADNLLSGRTEIDVDASKAGSAIRVPQFRIVNPQITAEGEATYADDGGAVDVAIDLGDLSRILPELQGPARLTLDATGDDAAWDITLDGSGAGVSLGGDGRVTGLTEGGDPAGDGTVRITSEDISGLSAIAGRDLAGAVDLQVEGRARFDLSEAELSVDGETRSLALGEPALTGLLAGLTELDVEGSKSGDEIVVQTLSLQNPQITVQGDGRYSNAGGAVDAAIELGDLSEILPELSGPAQVTFDADGDDTAWNITLDGSGAGLRIDGDGRVTGLAEGEAPAGEGTFQVTSDDIAGLSPIAGRDLGGAVDLRIEGGARFDLTQADLNVEGETRSLRLGQPEINALMNGLTRLRVDGAKAGDDITLRTLSLANPQVEVTGNGSYVPGSSAAQIDARFPDLGEIVPEMDGPATIAAFAEEAEGTWQVSLDGDGAGVMIDALAEVANVGTEAPIRIDGNADLQAEALSRFRRIAGRDIGGSLDLSVEGAAVADGSSFDVTARGRANDLRAGVPAADQLLTGQTTLDVVARRDRPNAPIVVDNFAVDASGVDLDASGSVLGGASDLTFDARLANLGVFVSEISGPVSASGRVGEAGGDLSIDASLEGPQGISANVDGSVARDFGRADLSLTGQTPLRIANPFIQPRALSGTANIDVALNGPPGLAALSGTVTTQGARFVDPGLPAVLENIALTARIGGQNVQLDVSADKQDGGDLRVSGPISLQPGYAADLAVTLDNLTFVDPRLYRTDIDGDLTVTGPLTGGARIAGRIDVGATEVRVPSTGLGVTGPIPDGLRHVNEPAQVRATRQLADLIETEGDAGGGEGGGTGFPLDILVVADNQIFVRGRGLDAELGGRLTLTGSTANVVPAGQFELLRGRLDLLGQRLDLIEGNIALRGDFSPFIRLVAETESGEVIVRIVVEGEVSDPTISFLSEPELPEDEVLSRLLFGRSIDQISPIQAAQLASAVATLAGRGGEGIVGRLRNEIGLDDLDVTTDDEGNLGVRAGAYISENVYTDVTVGSGVDAEINLNLDVTNNLRVRGGASSGGEGTVGIFFERDY